MKTNIYIIATVILTMLFCNACEDDDSSTQGGTPIVKYIRSSDVDASDSLISGAYLGEKITIIGNSLGGVNKIYFNDQKAKLNPNLVTDNVIIVPVPAGIPSLKEDLIKLYTDTDSTYYTFETKVPVPAVNSMALEYVNAGDTAHIEGLYFVDDKASPLEVLFEGNVKGEILTSDVNSIDVIVPEGAEVGPVTVKSVYGTGESSFWVRDNRNIVADFNLNNYPIYNYYYGWHGASGVYNTNGINGYYLVLNGESKELNDDSWDDSFLSWEQWTYLATDPDYFDAENLKDYVCKFEVRIFGEWSSKALQIIFTGSNDVMMNWNKDGLTYNPKYGGATGYVTDSKYPRALWMPWLYEDDASYSNDNWETVTIPMSEFKYGASGNVNAPNGSGHYSGITIFLNGGGITGTPCNATFLIDNLRIVPIN